MPLDRKPPRFLTTYQHIFLRHNLRNILEAYLGHFIRQPKQTSQLRHLLCNAEGNDNFARTPQIFVLIQQ